MRLRNIEQDDLLRMYAFNLDPDANRLAMTIPRSGAEFDAHWERVLSDPKIVAKAICVSNVLAGHISCFKQDGLDAVGYWIGREFWGLGIATRALQLLLTIVSVRPLHARVATSNRASLRVLQKCGFVIRSNQFTPTNDRFLECDETFLVLE
ncbi:MAG: GNAT family N-acetyltransferase [Planctomycetes bacterium]|nr:GNAT family N-acetyltransferase [Planctomycetota bacterium]